MPPGYLRAPDAVIQPGDIYTNVPWLFPLQEPEIVRPVPDGHYERIKESAAGNIKARELALCERRLVVAMLDPCIPPCEIDKMLPSGKSPRAAEDAVLAFFECVTAATLGPIWTEKLKHPERHKRLAPLPERLPLPGGDTFVAVQFRRVQHFTNIEVAKFTRIASLTKAGLTGIRVACDIYLDRAPEPKRGPLDVIQRLLSRLGSR